MSDTRHGLVTSPRSRAQILVDSGQLPHWQAVELEGGKFFPATEGNLQDSFAPDDIPNRAPPADGLIASGGHTDQRAILNQPGTHWARNPVRSGEQLNIRWDYTATHLTRRWNYFVTRDGWNPNAVLSRAQFEPTPFATYLLQHRPFWTQTGQLMPSNPTQHPITLPNKSGYHVILAVWEVADTWYAFYQAIDVDFIA
ncbi:MAG: lytic polysaccharide monooxygenase auxiliary activity family 9 protein [Mesorhizobium sp.]|jgi:chitin-binding protein